MFLSRHKPRNFKLLPSVGETSHYPDGYHRISGQLSPCSNLLGNHHHQVSWWVTTLILSSRLTNHYVVAGALEEVVRGDSQKQGLKKTVVE